MEVKEAKEFLENRHKYRLNRGSAFDISKMNEAVDLIIEVAKRGEKYEAIVKELEEETTNKTDIYSNWLRSDIKKLKQKYFPKNEVTDEKG